MWTLTYNGKLASQIAGLVAVVIKCLFSRDISLTLSWPLQKFMFSSFSVKYINKRCCEIVIYTQQHKVLMRNVG